MSTRYRTIKTFTNQDNIRYRANVIYPDIPVSENDTYIITTEEDRYDILAEQFYGNADLWWIIPTANGSSKRYSLYPEPGVQLRIPFNKDEIVSRYETLNSIR